MDLLDLVKRPEGKTLEFKRNGPATECVLVGTMISVSRRPPVDRGVDLLRKCGGWHGVDWRLRAI